MTKFTILSAALFFALSASASALSANGPSQVQTPTKRIFAREEELVYPALSRAIQDTVEHFSRAMTHEEKLGAVDQVQQVGVAAVTNPAAQQMIQKGVQKARIKVQAGYHRIKEKITGKKTPATGSSTSGKYPSTASGTGAGAGAGAGTDPSTTAGTGAGAGAGVDSAAGYDAAAAKM